MSYTAPEAAKIAGISYRQLGTPCREYQGCRTKQGYARRKFHGKTWYVHRYVWELANGPIPRGKCVLHLCDNPPCFRLDHLFIGTRQENSADMVAKGRKLGIGGSRKRTHCKRGHEIKTINGVRRCWMCKTLRNRGEL